MSIKQVGTDIQQILLDYLSAILKTSVYGLVYSELATLLQKQQFKKSTITSLTNFLESCSYLAYSPDSDEESTQQKLIKQAISLIKELNVK